jgi:hypothetical protein
VFGESLELGINLITLKFIYNSEFIQSLSCDISFQEEKVFSVTVCVLVCD